MDREYDMSVLLGVLKCLPFGFAFGFIQPLLFEPLFALEAASILPLDLPLPRGDEGVGLLLLQTAPYTLSSSIHVEVVPKDWCLPCAWLVVWVSSFTFDL